MDDRRAQGAGAPDSEWSAGPIIDIGARFRRLLRARLWILLSALVAAGGMAVLALMIKPTYRATVLFAPAVEDRTSLSRFLDSTLGQLGGIASLAGIDVSSGKNETQESLAVLRSRHFTESFIESNELMPRLLTDAWDSAAGKWKGSPDEWPTIAEAFARFDRKVRSLSENRTTGLIKLHIDWHDRNEAASWANELMRRLNAEIRERSIVRAEASIGYLKQELSSTTDVGTRDAINRLIEVQIRQRMLANVTDEYAFRIIDPALPPESDDTIKPKKALMIVLGALFGAALAACVVLIFGGNAKPQ